MHGTYSLHELRNAGLLLCLSCCIPESAFAAISTDGTVGAASNLAGPNYTISATLGTRVGNNLFHSFSVFNVNTGESATFTGPGNVSNIIARVTGGTVSTIDGSLNSTIPQANLVLVNPSGIVFGPNASLNVGGSFYASTANYVRLADGGTFDATTPSNSVLTTAPLAAFGFLGPTAPIVVQGVDQSVRLRVPDGQALSLIGGDITVTGGLMALGGMVNVASVASAGEVGVVPGLDVSGFASLGVISLDAPIDVSAGVLWGMGVSEQAGSIYIRGGQITTGASASLTSYTSNLAGGDIVVNATGALTMNQSLVSTDTRGSGHGGNIDLHAGSMILDNAQVYADTYDTGNAGSVTVTANQLDVLNGGWISSDAMVGSTGNGGNVSVYTVGNMTVANASITTKAKGAGHGGSINLNAASMVLDSASVYADTYDTGNAGSVTISANQLDVLNGSWISSDALTNSTGNGGSVNVTVAGAMTVVGGSITSEAWGGGHGGNVSLNAGSMVLDNASVYANTGDAGNAGNVTVIASQLDVLNGSLISSDALTNSTGNAGNVNINVAGNMTVTDGLITTTTRGGGRGGDISLTAANTILLGSGVQIASDSTGDGNAGVVSVTAPELNIDGGTISSTATGWGNGGRININVDRLILANLGTIDATASGTNAQGWGGDIYINATDYVAVGAGAQIRSDSTADAGAGIISITAPELNIDGGTISSTATAWGNGGRIDINVGRLMLANAGRIDATTSGTNSLGWGGDININATDYVAVGTGAQIRSDSIADASAGSISITAPEVSLDDGTISSAAMGWGDGGWIDINVDRLILAYGGKIDATTSSANTQGLGGDITINAAQSVALSGFSAEIKSDNFGDAQAGTIRINTPELSMDGGTISSQSHGSGNGGHINIVVDRLALFNEGWIDIGAFGGGNGGYVSIDASQSIDISSGATVWSDSWGGGSGGEISIKAPVVNIDGGNVVATAEGEGAGGQISVNANRLILANGGKIDASSNSAGHGGNIILDATTSISLSGGAKVASKSTSNGTAGYIRINSGHAFTSSYGSITTEAKLSDGGDISLVASDLIYLDHSNLTATVRNGVGNGGNIMIDPQFVVLNNSNVTANAFGGNGGNINLIANNFFQSANSTVTASSQLGVSGTVSLNTQVTDLSGSLANLPMVYLDTSGLSKQRCAAQLDGKISTFVLAGRGGIPQEPGSLMPSASLVGAASGAQPASGMSQDGSRYVSLSGPGFGCVN